MTINHPALQPVLDRSNVRTLVQHIQTLTPLPTATPEYRAGFEAARDMAVAAVGMMWTAAKISADAQREELQQELESYDDDQGDEIENLAEIAQSLLDLAVRLGAADQCELDTRAAVLADKR